MQSSKVILVFTGIFLSACAQIIPPTGGIKDETPPLLLSANPPNQTVNFNSKQLELQFDEYIQLKDINQELIVSPPLKSRPKVVQKKRGLFISFEEELLPNTTYTLNFGQAIADLNEGNVLPFQYVFSTGPVLDSMFISGKVTDAKTAEGIAGVKVMFYEQNIDSLPLLERPLYFARSAKDGSFRASNLKSGSYKVFALEESNGNYLYDADDERIAFMDSIIPAYSSDSLSIPLKLKLAAEYVAPRFIDSERRSSDGLLVIYPNKPWAEISVEYTGPGTVIYQKDKTSDSLRIWLDNDLSPGKHPVIIFNNETAIDTVDIEVRTDSDKKLGATCITGIGFKPEEGMEFMTDPRVKLVDVDYVQLLEDSISIPFELNRGDWPGKWVIRANYFQARNYQLILRSEAMTYGYKISDTLICKSSAHPASFYGNLKLTIAIDNCTHCLFELVNGSSEIARSEQLENGVQTFDFKELLPGNYTLRVLRDLDFNGKWSHPKYLQMIHPEEYMYYPNAINVRSNWDMDIKWEIRLN